MYLTPQEHLNVAMGILHDMVHFVKTNDDIVTIHNLSTIHLFRNATVIRIYKYFEI